ncbi:hypothetical protein THRCLA_02485 [Thraustotheca clavata]|uniref:Uncharacterized protein n=1 Tax=Thraustotheca clavata TaxID=74557 RepID=A0A1W0A513_9STRA|nr:hypothetical protein THRCLA_02485 [Thraustotheca clavata]
MEFRRVEEMDASKEPIEMILIYTMTLALSSSTCFVTCFTVFKWATAKANACHGTLFMVFLCLSFWFLTRLVYTFGVYLHGLTANLRVPVVLFSRVIADSLSIAASLWFTFSAYELQRWVFNPRSAEGSRQTMLRYYRICFGLAALYMFPIGILCFVELEEENQPNDNDLTQTLYYTSFIILAIRVISIVYPAGVTAALFIKGDDIRDNFGRALIDVHSYRSIRLVLAVFCALNVPFLMVDNRLISLGSLDPSTAALVRSFFKILPYSSGAAVSFVMGYYLAGFDEFYKVNREPHLPKSPESSYFHDPLATARLQPSFFVVSD